jgi:microsomal dipeptidase-like Zn-dependent dipeptidase
MDGWPAWEVLTAQQAYWEWLARAHQHGLQLMVMLAVNNSVLCQLAIHRNSFSCGDDPAVDRQIQGAKDLEAYIDARSGGPGQGFYRIVYSSADARQAIQAGKLAVVLGTEVDTEWGCTIGAASCTDALVRQEVQNYDDQGIRVVYPVHVIDNKFGGSAVYNGIFELDSFLVNGAFFNMVTCGVPLEWRSDIRETVSSVKPIVGVAVAAIFLLGPLALAGIVAAVAGLIAAVPILSLFAPLLAVAIPTVTTVFAIFAPVLAIVAAAFVLFAPDAVGSAPDANCNARGLSAVGTTLIDSLMDHRMIIDIDHTDMSTFDAILTMAETRHYPAIVSGHTGLVEPALTRAEVMAMGLPFDAGESGRHEGNKTDEAVQRILDVGGFLSLGLGPGGRSKIREYDSADAVAFDCGRSSEAWAQVYLYATKHLGMTAVGFGSDMNGFAGLLAPRYGSQACGGDYDSGVYDPNTATGRVDYATATDYFGQPISKLQFGNRNWDYNVEGFAHAGMYPDFIADLGAIKLSRADLAPLFNGAEAYVRMWEKADDNEPPTVRCGTVGEDWHAEDVSVPCLAFDTGWDLAVPADASFSLTTAVANGDETGDASTGTHAVICDKAGPAHCTATIPAITGINVDKKDPTVVVTTPAAGTPTYILNQVVPADYGCSDGGSGVGSCSGPVASGAPVDTSLGSHGFTVTGVDNVGHSVSVPHLYNVAFAICAVYDATKAHKAGSAVPIKLMLCDATQTNVSQPSVVLTATGVVQLSTSAPGVLEDAGSANPDDAFRYDAALGGYIFNLKTTGFQTGTYALSFTASGDPTSHTVQFQVR